MSTLSNWPPQLDLMQRFRGSPAAFPASFQSTATRIFVVWLSKICTTSIVYATIPGYLFAMMRPIQSASGRNRSLGVDRKGGVWGKSWWVRVDIGVSRIIKKKQKKA